MTGAEKRRRETFLAVHSGLPREGPGDRTCTERALGLVGDLDARPRLLDIACGPGMQTLDLARALPEARIDAIDVHQPFVDEARRRLERAGVAHRVTVTRADMRALPFAPGSYDLVWCEGAAYVMGVAQALAAWRPLLKAGGAIAFTELVWLRDDVPAAIAEWWRTSYPQIGDIAACRSLVNGSGYRVLGDFVLPESAWWVHYYEPMAQRLDALESRYAGDAVAEAVLRECRTEIDNYRRYSHCYGYLFLVARKAADIRVAEDGGDDR